MRAHSIFAFALAGLVGAGCSAQTATDTTGKEGDATQESDLTGGSPKYLGQIAPGETKSTDYTNPPLYRAYGFTAKAGDKITIDVKSTNYGDAMAWLTTTSWKSIAANDDANAKTLDSHIEYTVPAGTASKAYRLVFRDYDKLAATFDVTLGVDPAVPPTCSDKGKTYAPGDHWNADDDCNTCECTSAGAVSCTSNVCVCNPEAEPWRSYVATSPSQCELVIFSCTADRRTFSNACGCGCELLSH